jgi:starch synthase (maltosyl-transferring)
MGKLKPTDSRVVVESVQPTVDGGRFPIKRPLGDPVVVSAKVFADGHDSIACVLRHRRRGKRTWVETAMESRGNDSWTAEFSPSELGDWEFDIVGWVDHFGTWQEAMRKRVDAGTDVTVELLIGAGLVESAARRAEGGDAKALRSMAAELADGGGRLERRLEVAFSNELTGLMKAHLDRSRTTATDMTYPVMVDRELAVFSTWYELFPRSWSPDPGEHGTFADVRGQLDYVARMGFDVLYLPPIHPIGTTFKKGPNNVVGARAKDPGVPWAIGSSAGGHTAINDSLGTIEDFRELQDAAADLGIEIALDMAFQCSPDHPWVEALPGVVSTPTRRDHPICGEPAKEVPRHLSDRLRDP